MVFGTGIGFLDFFQETELYLIVLCSTYSKKKYKSILP